MKIKNEKVNMANKEIVEMMLWAKTMKREYDGLERALKRLKDEIVGMDDLKISIVDMMKYIISTSKDEKKVKKSIRLASKGRSVNKKKRSVEVKDASNKRKVKRTATDMDALRELKSIIGEENMKKMLSKVIEQVMEGENDSEYDPDDDGEESVEEDHNITTLVFTPISSTSLASLASGNNVKKRETLDKTNVDSVNLHTLLLGPPGTGKTSVANILSDIWTSLNLSSGKFKKVTRGDLVGKYQGHSTHKIRTLISEYKHGVIFIDEAYSLVTDEKDSFGLEVLAEIVDSMTSVDSPTFIFAGYSESVRKLLRFNEGLERRFNYVFELEKPSPGHMVDIFKIMVKRCKWKCSVKLDYLSHFFSKNHSIFKYGGGDIETLVKMCKRANVNRQWPQKTNSRIISHDLDSALSLFKSNLGRKSTPSPTFHMYS